jgi:hypothetical protein
MKLTLDERNQPAEGALVALPPLEQESGRLRWVVRDAVILRRFGGVHRFGSRFPLL